MGNNKVLAGVLVVLIAIIIGGYIFYGNLLEEATKEPSQNENIVKEEEKEEPVVKEEEKLEINATYDSKIVYTSKVSSDTSIYEADCEKRGWEFNECGSPCGPDAEFCTAVCAYTCEKPATKIETYTDIILGVSFDYPNDMEINDKDGGLRVYKWGPSQAEGTELYDGMVLSFMKVDNTDKLDLEAFAKLELENEIVFESEVVKPLEKITHGLITGYEFTTLGLGESTSFYFSNSAGEIIRASYFTEDPLEQGFDETMNTILESLKTI